MLSFFHFQAECRLAARRQARAEAREIRMREIERQQKEQEENADKIFDINNAGKFISNSIYISSVLSTCRFYYVLNLLIINRTAAIVTYSLIYSFTVRRIM